LVVFVLCHPQRALGEFRPAPVPRARLGEKHLR
jgi:hypothetical protein